VRDISNLLRPAALDGLGLLPALRALTEDFARRTRIDVQFEGPDTAPVLEPEAQVAIYRVLQEALTNVARHAHARRVRARLESAAGRVLLTVEDDGVGFGGPLVPNLGLLGMSERVSALGGTLRVTGAGGAGVRVEACIPAESPANRAT
jgi:two-component system NarL family sensor kinase